VGPAEKRTKRTGTKHRRCSAGPLLEPTQPWGPPLPGTWLEVDRQRSGMSRHDWTILTHKTFTAARTYLNSRRKVSMRKLLVGRNCLRTTREPRREIMGSFEPKQTTHAKGRSGARVSTMAGRQRENMHAFLFSGKLHRFH
jgi:hypothetical protein